MARSIRVEFSEAYYHVMARGNERKAIYREEEDRVEFLGLIRRMQECYYDRHDKSIGKVSPKQA